MNDEHMDMVFRENAIFSMFNYMHRDYTFKKEIEKAIVNYDEMVSNLISNTSVTDLVSRVNLEEIQADNDVFNISSFYDFCKLKPQDYPFVENERTA